MIRLLLASALCLSTTVSFAADADETLGAYNCKVHNPYGQKVNRVNWSGPCKDGFAHGTGKIDFDVKKMHAVRSPYARYEGAVEAGHMHGQGKLTIVDGTTYSGGFRAGRYDGQGSYADNFARYEGHWQAGLPHGAGKIAYAYGGSYDGQWAQGEAHGKGALVYAGGRKVEGDFVNGAHPGAGRIPRFTGTSDQPVLGRYVWNSRWEPMGTVDEPQAGRWVWTSAWSGAQVETMGYQQMTPAQRQAVRSVYPLLDENDEPPYPVDGIAPVTRELANPISLQAILGPIWIDVTVDKAGNPVGAKFYPTAHPDLAKAAAKRLLSARYKPGLCQGQPCEMVYPFRMSYDLP